MRLVTDFYIEKPNNKHFVACTYRMQYRDESIDKSELGWCFRNQEETFFGKYLKK